MSNRPSNSTSDPSNNQPSTSTASIQRGSTSTSATRGANQSDGQALNSTGSVSQPSASMSEFQTLSRNPNVTRLYDALSGVDSEAGPNSSTIVHCITMDPFVVFPPTDNMQRLACELVSRLGELEVKQLSTLNPKMKIFEYQLTTNCNEIFNSLLEDFTKTTANDVKLTVQTRARMMIPKRQHNEDRPQPKLLTLRAGRLTVPPKHVAILILLPSSKDSRGTAEIRIDDVDRSSEGNYYKVTEWRSGSSVLLFEGLGVQTEPDETEIPFINILGPILPLKEQ
ncbi:hypothetical protein CC78DRAFT_580884 [Lojkania enalia]|uniref:Uncharacterized protein n=1 Tax=Lojkania enalia TaxID=147567 RepID=A0A9P4K7D8_9PLEO|nr:hypothetical protein CC78DRAFT_580884 [Didymosphaeria enalia]